MTVYDESVHEAVARETARRRRVLLAFTALVIVPIAIGAYALHKAPSETEVVARNVTPVVAERVSARVTDDVVERTTPLIRRNVAREVESSVAPLKKNIVALQATVQRTSASVAMIQARVVPQTNDAALREQLDALSKQMSGMQDQLRDLQGRMKRLEEIAHRPRPQ